VTARVVDVAAERHAFQPGSRQVAKRQSLESEQEPRERDLPREVPVINTTSEERAGSRVVNEELRGIPERRVPQDPLHVDPATLNPEEQFLLRVAWDRPAVPLDGTINGEPAVAGYISGDQGCSQVGVTYPGRRVSEIWRVCADRQFMLERKAEPTPGVPDDPGLEANRMFAVHTAYNEGRASVSYGPMLIGAQTSGAPDPRGCVLIRSALTWQGIPMATRDETICRPAGE